MSYEIIVVGDIHGDVNILLHPLRLYLDNIKKNIPTKLIYLGDYLDRGHSTTYIYIIIRNILTSRNPIFKNIIFLRGNHECVAGLTMDPYRMYQTGYKENRYYIKSYLFDHFQQLPLKPFYYDESYNIMFSHAKLMRNISLLRGIKSYDWYDIAIGLYDDRGKCFTDDYLNIHGHDHHGLEPYRVENIVNRHLLNHDSKISISIDYDCSYGCQYISDLQNGLVNDLNSGTILAYLHIKPGSCKMISRGFDSVNYNNMNFNEILDDFPELSTEIKFTLDHLWSWVIINVPSMSLDYLHYLFGKNIRSKINTCCVYYDDMPVEFFEKMRDYKNTYSHNPFQTLIVGKCLTGGHVETFDKSDSNNYKSSFTRPPFNIMIILFVIMIIINCVSLIIIHLNPHHQKLNIHTPSIETNNM